MRAIQVVAAALLLGLCGCATTDKMVADGAPGAAQSKYRNSIAVRTVTGDCNISAGGIKPLICDPITKNAEIKEGLEKSLAASGLLANGTPRYYLDMSIEELRGPIIAFNVEIKTTATYSLDDGKTVKKYLLLMTERR